MKKTYLWLILGIIIVLIILFNFGVFGKTINPLNIKPTQNPTPQAYPLETRPANPKVF